MTVPPPPAVPGEWEPWVEKAGIAVADYLIRQPWDTSLTTLRMSHGEEIAGAVLRAVYGDIAEAARRPLLAEVERLRAALDKAREIIGEKIAARIAAEQEWAETADEAVEAARRDGAAELVARVDDLRVSLSPFSDYWRGYVDALSHVADLAYVPAAPLSATVSDRRGENAPAPVRDAEGPQIAAEGFGDE